MKFSFSLPRPEPVPSATMIDGYLDIARAIEANGLHAVSASDHPFPYEEHGQAGHQAHDPVVLLGYLAGATEHVKLHFSLIVLPYRNPFLVARMLGTLDLASKGRVIAGLGVGYLKPEFDALGADLAQRLAVFDEGVVAMRAAWSGEPVFLEGAGWTAAGNTMRPAPLTQPHPVLWRGGNTRKAIDHAVREFQGWSPFEVDAVGSSMTATRSVSLETIPAQMATLRESIERNERTAPFDVCLVRVSRRWQHDESQLMDELSTLAELGFSWLEFSTPGKTTSEISDNIERFAGLARRAGVLS